MKMREFTTGKKPFHDRPHNCICIRNYDYNYFIYSIKINGKIVEDPQQMLIRVLVNIHGGIDVVIETYNLMSEKPFTHASPI